MFTRARESPVATGVTLR